MLLSILSIIYFINKETSKMLEKKRLELACFSAVQMALADSSLMFSDSSVVNIDSSINVQLNAFQSGFWREITVSSKGINDSVEIKYLIGIKGNETGYFNNAIVFSRANLRATVVGNTEVKGDILGTSDQILTGSIFGEPAVKKDFHQGVKKVDHNIQSQLIPDSLFDKIAQLFSISNQDVITEQQEISQTNIEMFTGYMQYNFTGDLSFSGNIKLKDSNELKFKVPGKTIFTENTVLKKPIEIYSDSLIVISKNCTLENILLFSTGAIIIEEGCSFKNVQLFSTDSIHIEGAQFNYPSIICLNVNDSVVSKQNNMINIKNSVINGSILLMTKTAGLSNNRTKIKVDKESKVQGLVYSENNIELLGKVLGTVFAYNFWYYKEPTEYINWLINVKVDRTKLDKWFLLPTVFSNQGKYQILKEEWIY